MTIASETNKSGPYNGNGVTTVFAYGFRVLDETHIQVIKTVTATGVETVQTLTTHYTVASVGSATGSITMLTAPATGTTITIIRDVPFTQGLDLENQGAYLAEAVEEAFDKLTQLTQQLKEGLDRAVQVTASSSTDPATLIASLEASEDAAVASAATASADVVLTHADVVLTHADVVLTHADVVAAAASAALAASNIAGVIHAATEKTTPVAADEFGIWDSVSSALRRLTFTNLAATLFTGIGALIAAAAGKTTPADADTLLLSDSAASDASKKLTWANLKAALFGDATGRQSVCDGRLTLTSGTPVTTSDVTAAGTLYFTPYNGNRIALYASSAWSLVSFAEVSLALTLTSGKPYDIFGYSNAGTLTLESLVWTNDTTRATALTTQDGIYVKSGDATRRYLGTIYATATNRTDDSAAKRMVWNMYNRVRRSIFKAETADSWTYSTSAFQQANANAANKVEMIRGLNEDTASADVMGTGQTNTATNRNIFVAVGLDSTAAAAAGSISSNAQTLGLINMRFNCQARWVGYPGLGYHYLAYLEQGGGGDTQTWFGDGGGTNFQSGIIGEVSA